jgi:hypothetical protein
MESFDSATMIIDASHLKSFISNIDPHAVKL